MESVGSRSLTFYIIVIQLIYGTSSQRPVPLFVPKRTCCLANMPTLSQVCAILKSYLFCFLMFCDHCFLYGHIFLYIKIQLRYRHVFDINTIVMSL